MSEKIIDSSVEEHIHCHREDDTCLDKKHESELVTIKKELEKYKNALKEEVAKRSKAEEMLKSMQTVQKIHLESQNLSELFTSEYPNKDNNSNPQIMKSCELCDFSRKVTNELENHLKLAHQSRTCELCNKQYSTLIQIKRHNWRSHEAVDFSDCGEKPLNRHDLKRHRIIGLVCESVPNSFPLSLLSSLQHSFPISLLCL